MNKEILERGDMLNGMNVAFVSNYTKSLFFDIPQVKVGIVALGVVFSSMMALMTELMWIVVGLVICDFLLGVLRAIRDEKVRMKWSEALNTGIKIIIIGVGLMGVHLTELMIFNVTSISLKGTFVVAFLVAVGVGESTSILDHLCFHFPGFKKTTERIKKILHKELSS